MSPSGYYLMNNDLHSRIEPQGLPQLLAMKAKLYEGTKKSVSFFPHVMLHEMPHFKTLTSKEREALWYTHEEYQQIKDVCRFTVSTTMKESRSKGAKFLEQDEDEEICFRGLEGLTKEGAEIRKRNREAVWYAVFYEQELQERNSQGIYYCYDPRMIGQVSMEATFHSRKAARDVGLKDSQELLAEKQL